jgi:epoxyqueuosine reductase
MENITEALYTRLESRGLRCRAVPLRHLGQLQEDILERNSEGQFDEAFYRERISFFDFSLPKALSEAQSMLVVATPRPQTPVQFNYGGQTLTLILPPTYQGYSQAIHQAQELLEEFLEKEGYYIARACLPEKLLAVRSGLAEYGRNNITYIQGLGSFYQPSAFFSDLPCEEDTWSEARMLDRCQSCRACIIKCPTGAIPEDRFLLHAERCLVFHNERDASIPFPDWIDPAAHNCLIGCMLCQKFCPEDKPFLGWFEDGEEFDEEETILLLKGVSREQLPVETLEKLTRLELLGDLEKLPRNLGIFFRVNG